MTILDMCICVITVWEIAAYLQKLNVLLHPYEVFESYMPVTFLCFQFSTTEPLLFY